MAGPNKRPLPMEPSIDEILAGAKAALGRADSLTQSVDSDARALTSARKPTGAEIPSRTETIGRNIGPMLLPAAELGGSFLSGPVGMAAQGGMALEAIRDFVKNPGLMSGAGVALSALPGIGMARRLGKGAAAAEEAGAGAKRVFTEADVLHGPTHGEGKVLRSGDPDYYQPSNYGEPKPGRPITSPAFERRMYPEPLANSRVAAGIDHAARQTPIDPDALAAIAEDTNRVPTASNGDWDALMSRARGQADAISPGAPDPWRPGDLSTGAIHRAEPVALHPDTYPPTNLLGGGRPRGPMDLPTDEILEGIRKGVTRGRATPGERQWSSVPDITERVHEGGVKVEPGLTDSPALQGPGGHGSAADRMLNMSEGEQRGMDMLDELLGRTGHESPNPMGHGMMPGRGSGTALEMERMLRTGKSRARPITRQSAESALRNDSIVEGKRVTEGGVQRQTVDRGTRTSPTEALADRANEGASQKGSPIKGSETHKRTVMFGGYQLPDSVRGLLDLVARKR